MQIVGSQQGLPHHGQLKFMFLNHQHLFPKVSFKINGLYMKYIHFF